MKRLFLVFVVLTVFFFSSSFAENLLPMNAMTIMASYVAWADYYGVPDLNKEMSFTTQDETNLITIDDITIQYNANTFEVDRIALVYESFETPGRQNDIRAVALFSAIASPVLPETLSEAMQVRKNAEGLLGSVRTMLQKMRNEDDGTSVLFSFTDDYSYILAKNKDVISIIVQ